MKKLICAVIALVGAFLIYFDIASYFHAYAQPPAWQGDFLPFLEHFLSFNFIGILGVVMVILSVTIKRRWSDL